MNRLISAALVAAATTLIHAQDYSFRVEKSGQGEPLLLIPGLTCSGDVWDETVDWLDDTYECHVVTLPGFAGQPPIQTEGYLKTVGDELLEYLEAQKLQNTTVIGHSLGGFLSLYVGTRQSPLISGLIVVDGLAFMGASQNPAATPESMKAMAEMMRNNIATQSPEQYEQTQPAMLASMISDPRRIEIAMEWGRQSDVATTAQAMYELFQWDLRDEMDRIQVPVLVLGAWAGYRDYGVTRQMIQGSFDLQFAKLPQKEIKLSDEGKHFIMWDDPVFFNREVREFLEATYR